MPYVEFDGELDGAESSGAANGYVPFNGELDKPKGRTWGQVATDTAAQLGEGVNTIAGAVPNLVAPEGDTAAFFNRNAEFWRDKQSDPLKEKIASADKAISAAGEDGVISQISEAASQYFTDPALAARFVTTNLPSMIPGIGAAKLTQAAALARGATAARAAQLATTAAGASNAALNAGGARGEAFEDIKSTLIKQGMSPQEAEQKALADSRIVAAVGGLAGFVSGKTGLEKSLVGGATAKGAIKSRIASAASELAGEQLEEVTPKLATNMQASQYDNRSIGKDVGRTIVETAIGSGPGAVVSGAMHSGQPQATVEDITKASTIDEAITAAQAVVDTPIAIAPDIRKDFDDGPSPGFVRMYHGGTEPDGGPRWLSPDRAYAQGYANKTPGAGVYFVDVPENSQLLTKSFDDTGTSVKAPFNAFEAPPEIASQLKPVAQIAPDTRRSSYEDQDAIVALERAAEEGGLSSLEQEQSAILTPDQLTQQDRIAESMAAVPAPSEIILPEEPATQPIQATSSTLLDAQLAARRKRDSGQLLTSIEAAMADMPLQEQNPDAKIIVEPSRARRQESANAEIPSTDERPASAPVAAPVGADIALGSEAPAELVEQPAQRAVAGEPISGSGPSATVASDAADGQPALSKIRAEVARVKAERAKTALPSSGLSSEIVNATYPTNQVSEGTNQGNATSRSAAGKTGNQSDIEGGKGDTRRPTGKAIADADINGNNAQIGISAGTKRETNNVSINDVVVERYLGKYGKGMTGPNARLEAQMRNKRQSEIEWRTEPRDDLGYNYFEVVGYRKPEPVAQQPVTPDRRKDAVTRRKVAEMSTEEMRKALLTSELTGIQNKRAFEEHVRDNPKDHVLYGDLDDFKAMNTKYGHEGADQILRGVGAIKSAVAEKFGVTPYHRSGDEFLASSADESKLKAYGKALQEELSNATFEITMPDGSVVEHKNVGFSYGTGKDVKLAESQSDEQKAERKRLGLRVGSRGDVPVAESGREDNQGDAGRRDRDSADATEKVKPPKKERARKEEEPAQAKGGEDDGVLGNASNAANSLNDVKAAWDDAGITHAVSERNGVITLSKIIVPEDFRQSGKGTEAMRLLTAYADKTGQRIVLTASADFGGTKSRLIDFYKRLGFVENKGRNKDFSTMESMYRDPQGDLGKASAPSTAASFDQSIYDDIGAGKSSTAILERIAAESKVAANRELAHALIDAGITPKIELSSAEGQKFAVKDLPDGMEFKAAYSPKRDAILLFTPQDAERLVVHEAIHAGTYRALRKTGDNALRMKSLYAYVKKSGKADGAYGMSNFDEFTAEAMSNPEFQDKLRSITVLPEGSKFKNAWEWFVDLVRRTLGLPTKYTTALDQALRYGRGLMNENSGTAKQDESLGSAQEEDGQDYERVELFSSQFTSPHLSGGIFTFEDGTTVPFSDLTPEVRRAMEKDVGGVILDGEMVRFTQAGDVDDGNARVYADILLDPEDVAHDSGTAQDGEVLGNVGRDQSATSESKKEPAPSGNSMPEWLKSLPKETQDAAKKAGIWTEQKPLKERLKALRDKAVSEFQQGMFDQFAPLKELGDREYTLARLTKSADAPLEAVLLYGKPFLNSAGAVDVNLEKGGLIGALKQLQGEHDRFFAWIAGNRAANLKLQGKENLFSDTDISALKNLSQGKMDKGQSREELYKLVHQQFNGYSKAVLDIAEKAGIINGADRNIWESDFYVPFYRVMEDEGFKGPKNVSGMVNQHAFKKLKGGTDNLNDLMQNTLRNWSHLLSASLKNQAASAAIETAEKAGIATEVQQKQKGSVSILDDGKEKHYMVDDPFIMDAITSLEFAGFNNPVMKAMTKAKHYLTTGVTVSPTFKIRNLIRDQLAAVAVNPVSYNVMSNLADGWKGTNKESEQYAKMLTGGGLMRFGTFLEDDRAEHMKRLIDAGVDKKTILDTPNKTKAALAAAWDWWQEVGDRSENITRAAIYKQRYDQVIADGKSADEAHLMASFAARDSMDFSLQGKWGSVRFLSQLVPFMNARLQGLYKIGRDGVIPTGRMIAPQLFGDARTGDKAKARRFGAVAGAVSLASIALMLAYRDDDDYKEREEWDKDAFWWFKIGDTAYRIPKPFEIGAIGTIAERGLDTVLNGLDKPSRELFIERMGAMLTQTFAMNPIPQLFKPMIDLYANKDSFTDRPIETPGMEKLSKAERIGPNTSATAQAIGKASSKVGLSPAQIDFLINGYFSWLGTHATMTADFAMRPLMGLPEKPTRKWPDDYFVLGDFAKGLPSNQSKYVTKFYEQAKEVQEAMADIRYYQSMGNTEKALELRQENADKVRMAKMYDHAAEQISNINKRIKMIQLRNIDPDDKRDQIDRLNQQRNRLAKLIEEKRLSRQKEN